MSLYNYVFFTHLHKYSGTSRTASCLHISALDQYITKGKGVILLVDFKHKDLS